MKVRCFAWWGVHVHVHVNKHGEVVVGQNAENGAAAEEVANPADNPIVVVVAAG